MHGACVQGTVASVQILLRNHADPTITFGAEGKSCLQLSLLNEESDVLAYLLKIGLPVDEADLFGNTVLHDAAEAATDEVIDVLLRHHADKSLLDAKGRRPFHRAVCNRYLKDHVGVLDKLLFQESDVNLPDKNGLTPLHTAAGCAALPVVEWLLQKGVISVHATTMTAPCCIW